MSPVSTPELFDEAVDLLQPASPSTTGPLIVLSQTPAISGAPEEVREPTLSDVLQTIKVNHTVIIGKVEELKLDFSILC